MKQVSAFEKFAYSVGAFGQNMVYGLMSTYLMIFYTDNFGISAAAVGTLFLVARIWDAVMDPVIGIIVDRFNSKWGKLRPFILVGGTLSGILTIACFFNPDLGITGKMVYAYITYIVWGTTYGLMDVPYWSMSSTMTLDPDERTKIVSIPKLTGILGAVLVTVVTIPMVTAFGHGDNARGYFFTALIIGLICAMGAIFTAAKTKERTNVPKKEHEKFSKSINVVAKNVPLIIILLSTLFTNISFFIKQTVQTYYFTYIYGDVSKVSVFSFIGILPMILAMLFAAPFSKKVGKKNAAITVAFVSAVFCGAMYYCTNSLVLLTVFNSISMAGIGAMLVFTISMQADTVEYAEWKTGKRSESIIFSMGTFTTKLSSAIGGAFVGYWLSVMGYIPDAAQPPKVLSGINIMMSWAPAIGLLLMGIILMFYNLTEKRHAEILEALKERQY